VEFLTLNFVVHGVTEFSEFINYLNLIIRYFIFTCDPSVMFPTFFCAGLYEIGLPFSTRICFLYTFILKLKITFLDQIIFLAVLCFVPQVLVKLYSSVLWTSK